MMNVDKIVKKLLEYKTGTLLKITWNNNYTSLYELDTFYDTDNGVEMNDVNYREFHVALVKECKQENCFVEIGDSKNIPVSIELSDTNEVIWFKNNNQ